MNLKCRRKKRWHKPAQAKARCSHGDTGGCREVAAPPHPTSSPPCTRYTARCVLNQGTQTQLDKLPVLPQHFSLNIHSLNNDRCAQVMLIAKFY